MIEKRSVDVATCDACGQEEYTNQMGEFTEGYTLRIDEHASDTRHEAFACKETHIAKSARAVLENWRHDDPPLGHMYTETGKLPSATVTHNHTDATENVVPGYADDDSDDLR